MPFFEYEDEKRQGYWKKYKDRQITSMALLMTNDRPKLCIKLEEA